MTIRRINLLNAATADDPGAVRTMDGTGQTFQAYLDNAAAEATGTATVLIQATNDARARTAETVETAAWLTLATFTLDAAEADEISDAFKSTNSYTWVRANVTAIANDASVTVVMTESKETV